MTTTDNIIAQVFSDIADQPVWVAWKFKRGKKRDKLPLSPQTGEAADTGLATDWGTLSQAEGVRNSKGVGIVLTRGVVGVDLDGCRDPSTGELTPWAEERVKHLNSYTEVSPSGTGVKVFLTAEDQLFDQSAPMDGEPVNGKSPAIELWSGKSARFFTVTGEHLSGTPQSLSEITLEQWRALLPDEAGDDEHRSGQGLPEAIKVQDALRFIPADDRYDWFRVTCALKVAVQHGDLEEDEAVKIWRKWSETAPDKFDEHDNQKVWDKLKDRSATGQKETSLGTVYYLAKQNGWPGFVVSTGLPEPIGYTGEGNFVLLDRKRSIIRTLNSGQLLAWNCLLEFAPTETWAEQFPPGEKAKSAFNTVKAGNTIMEACKAAGPFDPTMVRGRGAWLEGDQVVLNFGKPMPENLNYTYVCFKKVELPEVTKYDTQRLLDMLSIFYWRDPNSATLFLGWLFYAVICGALEWRPHVFVLAERASGKTALFGIADKLLTPLRVETDGGSSEAGIRQSLGPDSRPVLIDDFETDKRGDEIKRILLLMRASASSNSTILRGTVEGKAIQFSPNATFFAGGINTPPMTPQDQDRIVVLEMDKHKSDREEGRKLKAEIAHFRDLGPRWCGYCLGKAELLRPSRDVFDAVLPEENQRTRLTFATLLGAAYVALEGVVPTEADANAWAERFSGTIEHHSKERADRDNPAETLDHLLAHIPHGERYNLSAFICWSMHGTTDYWREQAVRVTRNHGIEVRKRDDGEWEVFVVNRAPLLEELFQRTPWRDGAWISALRRVDGVKGTDNAVWMPSLGKSKRCTVVPGSMIPRIPEPEDEHYTDRLVYEKDV